MSTVATTRAKRATEAARLKATGMNGLQIARVMGVSNSYAYELLSDPEGSRVRARKDGYRGVCRSCGELTDGSNGAAAAPSMCNTCANPPWSREDILAAFRAFHECTGRSPRKEDGDVPGRDLPHERTVAKYLGSWNNALRAAGLPLNRDRDRATSEAMAALRASGLTYVEIAERYGCDASNVWQRVKRVTA